MILIDDILASPARGMGFIFRSIHNAVSQEIESEKERIRSEINTLYMALENGEIDEDEFDEAEEHLLDRLDSLEAIQ